MGRVLGVIPARLTSTRLPRKPLHPVGGRPLLEWVWTRARRMSFLDDLVVAVDGPELLDACVRFGARAVLTDPDHPSGTDRVAEVALSAARGGATWVVNIQGDEPLVNPDHVRAALDLIRGGSFEIGTCAAPVRTLEALDDPSVVKVARAADGRALYFSRAPIPFRREGRPSPQELTASPFLRHAGIYAYSRTALADWVALPPSPLEELERLEQLRPLEAGARIGVAVVDHVEPGVDTPDDVLRVEARMREIGDLSYPGSGP